MNVSFYCLVKNTSSALIAYKRGPSHDSSSRHLDHLLTFLAESKDTDGGFTLIESSPKPGHEPPPHVHEREDELFYILAGEMDVYVGEQAFRVRAGECCFLPKLKPHTFVIRSPRIHMLALFSPAGFEGYIHSRRSRAEKLELPSGRALSYSTPNLEHATRVGEEYGIRFLSADEFTEQMPLYVAALKKTPQK